MSNGRPLAAWFTRYRSRRLEWIIAIYTVLFGVWLVLPPVSMATTAYQSVLAIMPEGAWGGVFLAVGGIHIYALHINGRAAWTPVARLWALAINSVTLLAVGMGFAVQDMWGTGAFTYIFLSTGFCGPALWTAALDCGNEWAIWKGAKHGP